MQKFYKRFEFFFKWLFIGTFIFFILEWFHFYYLGIKVLDFRNLLGFYIYTDFVLISFILIFGILYILIGIIIIIIGFRKKKRVMKSFGTLMIVKGLWRVVIISVFSIFYCMS